MLSSSAVYDQVKTFIHLKVLRSTLPLVITCPKEVGTPQSRQGQRMGWGVHKGTFSQISHRHGTAECVPVSGENDMGSKPVGKQTVSADA